MSDVCKHCTHAGCLDACPTGALIRTEFDTVVLQPDVCNGCGYCIPACPFGVVDRDQIDGRAAKCTLCYDRLAGRARARVREGVPDRLDPVRALRRAASTSRERRVTELHRRGTRRRLPVRRATTTSRAASARSSCSPSRRSATACPPQAESPIQENVVPATLAAMGAGLLAAAGVAAAFVAARAGSGGSAGDAATRRRRSARRASRALAAGASRARAVALQQRGWRDAQWSYLYGDDTSLRGAARPTSRR